MSASASAACWPEPAARQEQPPLEPLLHTLRVWQTPTEQEPSSPQGPTTCETVQGPESGGRSPPQPRVSMHCLTLMHVALPVHVASELHSAVGEQRGPA